jgi:hypothetical protein
MTIFVEVVAAAVAVAEASVEDLVLVHGGLKAKRGDVHRREGA